MALNILVKPTGIPLGASFPLLTNALEEGNQPKMTYALIDNATLTGVQRVTGEIETKSRHSVDTDIIALENLIQAILFYDTIVAIDNYKPEYRNSRINGFPYVKFISEADFNLAEIETTAYAEAEGLRPEIRGGEFADEDFRNFFQLLKTHVICTWALVQAYII